MRRILVTHDRTYDVSAYLAALRAAGVDPVAVTPEDSVRSIDGFDGLLLSGGVDVDPALYGQEPDPRTETPDPARDAMEQRILRESLERGVPVLAICRGLQLLNVTLGGTLRQHVEGHATNPADKSEPAHEVVVAQDSQLAAIVGAGRLAVNSRHHQALDTLAPALTVVARAADGTVEACECTGLVAAVQWHPEDMAPGFSAQRAIFEAFAAACHK